MARPDAQLGGHAARTARRDPLPSTRTSAWPNSRWPERRDFAAEHVGHQLHAVADAEHRHAELEHCRRRTCGAPASETLFGPPDRMMPTGCFARSSSTGVLNGRISRVDRQLAQAPRDQLRVLRPEIQDENGLMRHGTRYYHTQGTSAPTVPNATTFALVLCVALLCGAVCLGAAPKKKILPVPLPILPAEQAWIATLDAQPSAPGSMDSERVYIPMHPNRSSRSIAQPASKVWTRDIETAWMPVLANDTST